MFGLFSSAESKTRKAYWDKPDVGRFRIIFKAPHFHLERFDAESRSWKYVDLGRDKDKMIKSAEEFKRREHEAPVYFD